MKKKLSVLFLICILSALSINATVYNGSCGDNVNYSLNTETGLLSITGTGTMTNYNSSSDPWSSNRSYIKVVEISDGVTSIGDWAFYRCSGLTSVTIPNSVTSIGEWAFVDCSGLTSITIPNSVTSIGYGAFQGCSGLTSVTIPNSVTSIGGQAFWGCSGLTSVTIPNSVTSIGNYAFADCSGLTSITIPNSVTNIRNHAFFGCSGLTSISVESGNEKYDSRNNCNAIIETASNTLIKGCKNTIIPNSVTSIGGVAFDRCSGLTSVTIPNSVTSIGDEAFSHCSGLTSVTIPNSVTSIEGHAFDGCSSLTSVISEIEEPFAFGSDAFSDIESSCALTVPYGTRDAYIAAGWTTDVFKGGIVEKDNPNIISGSCGENVNYSLNLETGLLRIYGTGAMEFDHDDDSYYDRNYYVPWYSNRLSITAVEISDGVTSIGEEAFEGCSNLTSVTIPNSVTDINRTAFKGCSSLTSITIPNSVTEIGRYVFSGCTGLTSVHITDLMAWCNILFQSELNFSDDSNPLAFAHHLYLNGNEIKDLVIPNGVLSIIDHVFEGCSGLTSVTIPSSVTSIGLRAFEGCSGLTSVNIPNSVTSIGEFAFHNCSGLTSVNIGNAVKTIGGVAFNGCSGLTSVTIPNSVTSIGYQAFQNCSGLTSVISEIEVPFAFGVYAFGNISSSCTLTVPYGTRDAYIAAGWTTGIFNGGIVEKDNPNIISGSCGENVNYSLNLETGLLRIYGTGAITSAPWKSYKSDIKNVEISDGVTSIGSYAFENCSGLTSVTIGNSVTSIGYQAFQNCSGLTSITIPNSVTSIEGHAFDGCSSLTSITIPNSVTRIGELAFYNCTSLTSIEIPNSVTSIGNYAFYGCSGLTSVTIPNSVTSIGNYAFANCSGLTSVTIGNSVTSIGNDAFANCSGLTSVTIPNSVTSIGEYAFSGCSGLTSVTIPNSVTSIGNDAFSGCSGLTSVTIGNSVTSIGYQAFQNCSGLTSVTIGNSVASIGNDAFYNCNKLKEVRISDLAAWCIIEFSGVYSNPLFYVKRLYIDGTEIMNLVIPDDVTSIGSAAFAGCSSLTSVTIPNSVTSIGSEAFRGCSGLTSIEIPNSVTSIGNYAFYDCSGLTSVTIPNSVTSIGSAAFAGCSSLTSVTIGNSVTSIGNEAFSRCSGLTSVTIGNSVTSIGRDAFYGCYDLKVHISDLAAWCNISFGGNVFYGEFILSLNDTPLQGQIVIPDGTTRISSYSFQKVKDAYSFVIPSTVQTIENNAFKPDYIKEVIINTDNVVSLASASVFSDKTAIYVKDDLVSDYRGADQWSDIKNQIYVKGCRQLTVDLEATPNSPALLTALTAWEQTNSEYKIARLADLKIKGTLNGWDILMIRNKMPNLHRLDLGEATILDNDGGMEYYQGCHTTAGTISPCTFYKLDNLKEVALPKDITSIESTAFAFSGLQSISIPGTVKEIKSSAFSNCAALNNVDLPETLKKIDSYAFSGCSSLTDIEFAEGLEEIGNKAFEQCSKLNNLHLPTSLAKIGGEAFYGCSTLSEVHVPSMITEIGDYAFKNCGLKSVYAYTVVPIQINQNTFDYDGVDLYAPANSFYAYYLNTQWSQFLNIKEFDALYTNWYMPKNSDLEIDTDKPITSQDEEKAADGEMEAGSGMIITGDGEQEVNELVMESEEGEGYPTLIENDNLTVEKLTFKINVRPGRWYFFSFPFDVNMSDIKHAGKWVWRYYDSATRAAQGVGGWKNTVGDVLKANQGYIFQCNTKGVMEISVAKPVFGSSEEKDVALEYIEAKKPQDASWNFVGNPNLSYYSLDDMAEKFDAPITVWNDEQQTYTAVIPGDDDYNFHPFEAYFVQTPENVDKMTFENENRATYLQSEKKKSSNQARSATRSGQSVNEKRMLVNLTVSDGQTTDKTRVIFNDDNKMTYETGRDANKFISMANVPQIYTIDAQDVKYSINARPNENRQVRVGYVASSDGNYTIAAERMDCRMALKDNVTGTVHQLDEKPYSFYSEAGTFESRFTLISGADITSINTNGLEGIQGLDITAIDGGISVAGANEGDLNVYNANGIKAGSLQGSGTIMLANGTYIITYAGKSTKIVIK